METSLFLLSQERWTGQQGKIARLSAGCPGRLVVVWHYTEFLCSGKQCFSSCRQKGLVHELKRSLGGGVSLALVL